MFYFVEYVAFRHAVCMCIFDMGTGPSSKPSFQGGGLIEVSVDGGLPGVVFPTTPLSIGKVSQKLVGAGEVRVSIVGHKVESSDSGYKIQPEEDIVLEAKAVTLCPALALAPEPFMKLASGSAHSSLVGSSKGAATNIFEYLATA